MRILLRAYYTQPPLRGHIRVSQVNGDKPLAYTMTLMHDNTGITPVAENPFPDLYAATTKSLAYGYNPNLWNIEEVDTV